MKAKDALLKLDPNFDMTDYKDTIADIEKESTSAEDPRQQKIPEMFAKTVDS